VLEKLKSARAKLLERQINSTRIKDIKYEKKNNSNNIQ